MNPLLLMVWLAVPGVHAQPVSPDTCIQGYVWREAYEGDRVCVTPHMHERVAEDNRAARGRWENDGAFGSRICRKGYVWRAARADDVVCVSSRMRQQVAQDNARAESRRVGAGNVPPAGK